MDKAGGESIPGRETTYAKAQACNPVAHSRVATAVHFCSVGRLYTVGKEKAGGMQDSGGHRRRVTKGTLAGLSLTGSGWLLRSGWCGSDTVTPEPEKRL